MYMTIAKPINQSIVVQFSQGHGLTSSSLPSLSFGISDRLISVSNRFIFFSFSSLTFCCCFFGGGWFNTRVVFLCRVASSAGACFIYKQSSSALPDTLFCLSFLLLIFN